MRRQTFAILLFVALAVTPAAAQSPCATLTNPAAIVACEQERAGGAAAMHESRPDHRAVTVTVLRQAAASLNAAGIAGGPFGILVKTGGENCDGYSCDIICSGNGSAQRQWDVFAAVHQASTPGWDGPLSTIAIRPCEFVAGVTPSPGPGPTPIPQPAVDLTPVLAKLDALSAQVGALQAKLDASAIDAANAATRALSILDLIKQWPPPGAVTLPPYKGSLFGISIVSKPCPTCK